MESVVGKVVLLGSHGVGKTSLVARYVERSVDSVQAPTVGASFFTCRVKIEDNIRVKLQIWDTAGEERFKAMAPIYYRNSNAAFLVFDITDRLSFENIQFWVKELKRNVHSPMYICIIGNKIDLNDQRVVDRDEAIQYSKSMGASYFESSAKEDQGIEQIFLQAAVSVLRLHRIPVAEYVNILGTDSPMAAATDQNPTDVGKTEVVNWSIESIAHADLEKSGCCY